MSNTSIIAAVIAVVLLVLYVMRRRSRLGNQDLD
jgi:hypothetical protein